MIDPVFKASGFIQFKFKNPINLFIGFVNCLASLRLCVCLKPFFKFKVYEIFLKFKIFILFSEINQYSWLRIKFAHFEIRQPEVNLNNFNEKNL